MVPVFFKADKVVSAGMQVPAAFRPGDTVIRF